MKAKRKILKFDFASPGSHVALVTDGANNQEVLLVKSAHTMPGQIPLYEISEHEIDQDVVVDYEVQISTSMQIFLKRFFNLYSENAETLAGLLGYATKDPWMEDEYGKDIKVEFMKSQFDNKKITVNTYNIFKSLYDKYGDKINEYEEKLVKTEEEKAAEIKKAIDDAVAKAVADVQKDLDSKNAELEKAKKEVEELAKINEQKDKDALAEVVKGYSFVEDGAKFVDTIFKLRKLDGFDVILSTLEKAQEAINAAVTKEAGVAGDVPVNVDNIDKILGNKVNEILKKRKEKK